MRVLVTGGAGFIGSHTVDKLIDQGAEVMVVDNLSTGNINNLNPMAAFKELDILSKGLGDVFDRFKPEFVIHLAAQVSVANSIKNPVADCSTNVLGTVNLLENCRLHGVKKVVYSSTAAVYGDPDSPVITEESATVPLSFYGVSKLAAEKYFALFHHIYGLNYTVLRYANVYGPRQDACGEGGVISIFASKMIAGENPVIYGDGEQTRDFIYVDDVARANVNALHKGDLLTINVGTGRQTSINALFSLMARAAGLELQPVYDEARPGDIRHSCMDNSLAVKALAWTPRVSLKDGLARTLEFYRNLK